MKIQIPRYIVAVAVAVFIGWATSGLSKSALSTIIVVLVVQFVLSLSKE